MCVNITQLLYIWLCIKINPQKIRSKMNFNVSRFPASAFASGGLSLGADTWSMDGASPYSVTQNATGCPLVLRFSWDELQSGHGITTNQILQRLVRSTSSSPVLGSKKERPVLLGSSFQVINALSNSFSHDVSRNSKQRSHKISLALCRCFALAQKKSLKACFGQLDQVFQHEVKPPKSP